MIEQSRPKAKASRLASEMLAFSLFDVADVGLAEAGSGAQAPLREAARGAQSNEIVGEPIANLSAGFSVQVELSLEPT
jgi:hypothetical protein